MFPSERQQRAGAVVGMVYAGTALAAHFFVPTRLEEPLGLRADPWYRSEIGTVNAGFLYGALRHLRGDHDDVFLRSTAISALSMAVVRSIATARGQRRAPVSAAVIAIDVVLGLGALIAARAHD